MLDENVPQNMLTPHQINLENVSISPLKSSDKLEEHALHLAAPKCNNGPLGVRMSAAEAWRRAMVSVYEPADQWCDKHAPHLFMLLVTYSIVSITVQLYFTSSFRAHVDYTLIASSMLKTLMGAFFLWFGGRLMLTWKNWQSITRRKASMFTVDI